MKNPEVKSHMRSAAKSVANSQGGTYVQGGGGKMGKGEVFDKNRGSDKGGSNSPKKGGKYSHKMSY